ncbi:MAG: DUF2934 domain-containing protein [Candidatus Omnitrophota bacterium]|nr:DUF2934 domain-containing protein [Candidatus Omnitrophota bacterium]
MMKKVIKKLTGKSLTKKKSISTGRKKASGKISSEELFSLIEKKAYDLYVERGYTHGDHQVDWYKAEKLVLSGLKKK